MSIAAHPVVVVTGGRDYAHWQWVFHILSMIHEVAPGGIYRLIHGACSTGADAHAAEWCKLTNGIAERRPGTGVLEAAWPADWKGEGRAAGPRRNGRMLRFAAEHLSGEDAHEVIVLAFPGGRGTADCVRQAKALGLTVWDASMKGFAESMPADWPADARERFEAMRKELEP